MSFLNPWYFLGLLAGAVPILLHLMKRERAQKVDFPTLMFLRRISKKTVRFQKLRHLLLLLLRLLAVILLVSAFVRPYRSVELGAQTAARQGEAHLILLDNSLSMAYGDRWQRAKFQAAAIIRGLRPADRVAVVEFSDRAFVRVPLNSDHVAALRTLETEVELSDRATRYEQALRAAERLALDAGGFRKVLHVVSDFQRNGITAESHSFRLGSGIEVEARDVGDTDFSNLAFSGAEVQESDRNGEVTLTLKATVVNFGNRPRRSVRLTFLVDERKTGERTVDLAPSATVPVEFDIPPLGVGQHTGAVVVEDSGLTRDNRFLLVLENRGKTPVVIVDGPAPKGGRPASFFLASALNVAALSPFRLLPATAAKVESGDVPAGGILVWNNAASGSQALQSRLASQVRDGSGLVIVVADGSAERDFNAGFGSWLPVKTVQETPTVSRRVSSAYSILTDFQGDHPIFRPFQDPHSGNFSAARFFKHVKLAADAGADVAARFDNGDPAVVTASVGQGRVVVLPFSADDSGNDLPLKPVFAPFWQQVLQVVSSTLVPRRWYEVGETIPPAELVRHVALLEGRRVAGGDQVLAILDPSKNRLTMPSGADRVEVAAAGFYQVRSSRANSLAAVNPPPRESDLTRGNVEEMVAGWVSTNAGQVETPPGAQASAEEKERLQRWWRPLLMAVIALLVAEALLAGRLAIGPDVIEPGTGG